MPERQCIADARLANDDFKLLVSRRSRAQGVHSRQGGLEQCRRILEERSTRTAARPSTAERSRRNNRFAAIAGQRHQPKSDMQEAAAVLLNFHCVFAAEIDG